jgi:translation initiation factor 1
MMAKKRKLTSGDGWSLESDSDTAAVKESLLPSAQKLKIKTEKRQKGKIVTLISGFALTGEDLKKLAKKLKNACGTGGTVKDSCIELQGEVIEKARSVLSAENYTVN